MPLQNGEKYDGKVLKHKFGDGPSGPQIGVLFELVVDGETFRLPWYGSFSEAAFPQTERGLRACGWQGVDLDRLEADGFGTRPGVCTVEYRDDSVGKPGWRVAWVESPNDLGVPLKAELDSKKLSSFSAAMRGRFMSARGTPATPGTVPRNSPPLRPPSAPQAPAARPSWPPPAAPQAQRMAAGAEHEPPPGGGDDFGAGYPSDEGDDDIPF